MVSMQISSPTGGGYGDDHHPEDATASCISGFFRRLLCKNLPTLHPPDDDYEDFSRTESEGAEEERREMKLMADMPAAAAAPSPNIVARLMGLESMPEFDWMPRTPDSLGRSRSANFSFHSWFDSDPTDLHKSHRRVKTSSSFREIPTFLRRENDDFLLLSFDFDHHKEIRSFPSFSSSGAAKEKKRDSSGSCKEKSHEAAQVKKKKKCDSEIVASRKKVSERKSGSTGEDSGRELDSKLNRMRRSGAQLVVQQESCHSLHKCSKGSVRKGKIGVLVEKKAESDSSSENSSPVSVLDRPFEAESEFPPPEQIRGPKSVESARKKELVVSKVDLHGGELRTEQKKTEDQQMVNDASLWKAGFHLANEEILRNLNWVSREWWGSGEFEETGMEIGLQIMDSLVCNLIEELSTTVINA